MNGREASVRVSGTAVPMAVWLRPLPQPHNPMDCPLSLRVAWTPRCAVHTPAMPKAKRTTLPPVTPTDILEHPERVRRTSNGWAWRCHYCGKFASSETLQGKYVCRDHGGSTPAQRDPAARVRAKQQGQPAARPPGRPMNTGVYSKSPAVRVDALVADYQARQLNADCTEEDMLYLRAHLEELRSVLPDLEVLRAPLQDLRYRLEELLTEAVSTQEGATVEGVLELLGHGKEWGAFTRTVLHSLQEIQKFRKDIENQHTRLIHLSKVRADTRLKNAAAEQLEVFDLMVRRFMVVLQEQLTPQQFEALQKRIARDLSELPQRALEGGVKA